MATTMREFVCANGHETTVQSWAPSVPTVCPFAPCAQAFLTPAQKAAATRKARRTIEPQRMHITMDQAFALGLATFGADGLPSFVGS